MEILLSSRVLADSVSPCGANCSYTVVFEGPYLDCSARSFHGVIPCSGDNDGLEFDQYSGKYNLTTMSIRQLLPISAPIVQTGSTYQLLVNETYATITDLVCRTAAANYTATFSYENGVRNITYTTAPPVPLSFNSRCSEDDSHSVMCRQMATIPGSGVSYFYKPMNWTPEGIQMARDMSINALIQKLEGALEGTISGACRGPINEENKVGNFTFIGCVLHRGIYNTFAFSVPLLIIASCSLTQHTR